MLGNWPFSSFAPIYAFKLTFASTHALRACYMLCVQRCPRMRALQRQIGELNNEMSIACADAGRIVDSPVLHHRNTTLNDNGLDGDDGGRDFIKLVMAKLVWHKCHIIAKGCWTSNRRPNLSGTA